MSVCEVLDIHLKGKKKKNKASWLSSNVLLNCVNTAIKAKAGVVVAETCAARGPVTSSHVETKPPLGGHGTYLSVRSVGVAAAVA